MDIDEENPDEESKVDAIRFNVTRERRDVIVMRWTRVVQDLAEAS